MSVLRQASTDYFAIRRALGFKLIRSEKLLRQFITYLEQHGKARITMEMAVAWAILPQAGQNHEKSATVAGRGGAACSWVGNRSNSDCCKNIESSISPRSQ